MNYFIEGFQGSGKSTLAGKLSKKQPGIKVFREGDYFPVELAWCAYMSNEQYSEMPDRYKDIQPLIEEKSHSEGDKTIVCYTQIKTGITGFYEDLERYEIYNDRVPYEEFRRIIKTRFGKWQGDEMIFECSLFQNIVEDMILFRRASDEEILDFYREIAGLLIDRDFQIMYLYTENMPESIGAIRKERSDGSGNELWFPMMLDYFNGSPYALKNGVSEERGYMSIFVTDRN